MPKPVCMCVQLLAKSSSEKPFVCNDTHCDNVKIGQPYTLDQCRVCWLWFHDMRYRELWRDTPIIQTRQPFKQKCIHLGELTGETVLCPSCMGKVELRLYSCAEYRECLPVNPGIVKKPSMGAILEKFSPEGKGKVVACCLNCTKYYNEEYESTKNQLTMQSQSATQIGSRQPMHQSQQLIPQHTEQRPLHHPPIQHPISSIQNPLVGLQERINELEANQHIQQMEEIKRRGHRIVAVHPPMPLASQDSNIVKNMQPQLPNTQLKEARGVKWAYGVTTTLARKDTLLPKTLASLKAAGFENPRLFVDGLPPDQLGMWQQVFELEITARYPTIRTYGNWILSLAELYIREPTARRYAIFQDDIVLYRGLRGYLDACAYPDGSRPELVKGYWNLYTFPENLTIASQGVDGKRMEGWYHSNQRGRGALALVFNREAVITLFTHQHMVQRPMDAHRGWKAVDGGIVETMKKAGWKEYVHNPSLVQHTGVQSSMGNMPHPLADSFRGEDYNARELLHLLQR